MLASDPLPEPPSVSPKPEPVIVAALVTLMSPELATMLLALPRGQRPAARDPGAVERQRLSRPQGEPVQIQHRTARNDRSRSRRAKRSIRGSARRAQRQRARAYRGHPGVGIEAAQGQRAGPALGQTRAAADH